MPETDSAAEKGCVQRGWWWPRNSMVFFFSLELRVSLDLTLTLGKSLPCQADFSLLWLWWATVVINLKACTVSAVVGCQHVSSCLHLPTE